MISRDTVRRLVADIKDMMQEPLTEHGIYYSHDEDELLKGYCMIVGPSDTPYAGGYYFFDIAYPITYPHAPPIVTYCTNGDNVRFNPNLYVNGKVCVSLLNTWRGEQWTSCQTTRSILLTLCTLLCKNALLNEPGISKSHEDFTNYETIFQYTNVELARLKMYNRVPNIFPARFDILHSIMREQFQINAPKAIEEMSAIALSLNNQPLSIATRVYKMAFILDYAKLIESLHQTLAQVKVPHV